MTDERNTATVDKSVRRLETWRQLTPAMQLTALRMCAEGHHENFRAGIIESSTYHGYMDDFFDQLEKLQPFIRRGSWE